ncbi:putative DENN domain-containing protein [Sesbania bispinosa]|nr:putative DENN domain-containing protein [Sesbania bispinosa]
MVSSSSVAGRRGAEGSLVASGKKKSWSHLWHVNFMDKRGGSAKSSSSSSYSRWRNCWCGDR